MVLFDFVIEKFKRISFYKSTQSIYNIFQFLLRRFSVFYSANIIFVIFVSLLLFYYLVAVNIKPFSSYYLKDKMTDILSKGEFNFKPSEIFVSFTKRGTVKLNLENSDFSIKENRVDILNRFNFDRLEMEIPIYRILFFNFTPSFLIINDAEIDFNSISSGDLGPGKVPNLKFFDSLSFFDKVKLTNVKLSMRNRVKGDIVLNLKNSEFSINKNGDFTISNLSEIDYHGKIMKISSNCAFNFNFRGNCRFYFSDFNVSVISKLFKNHSPFDYLKGSFDVGIALSYDKNIEIKANIASKKINILKNAKFDKSLFVKDLNFNIFSKVSSDFSSIKIRGSSYIPTSIDKNSHGKMSYNIISDDINDNIVFDISSKKIEVSEILDAWPKSYASSLRNWLLKNANDGFVTSSSVSFNLLRNSESESYKVDKGSLSALIDIFDINLLYNKHFPSLKKCDIHLQLDADNLDINLNSARTNIDDQLSGVVKVSNLSSKPMMDVDLKFDGYSSDFFTHISYKDSDLNSALRSFFDKSKTKSNIKIKYPLFGPIKNRFHSSEFNLKFISSSIYNDYLSGSVSSSLIKPKNSRFFSLTSNFNDSFTLKPNIIDIKKNHDDSLTLSLDLLSSNKNLILRNFLLSHNKNRSFVKIPSLVFDKNSFKIDGLEYIQNTHNQKFTFLVKSNGPDNFSYDINGALITIPAKKNGGGNFLKTLNLKRFFLNFDINTIASGKNNAKDVTGSLYCARGHCPEVSANGFYDSGLLFKFQNDSKKSYTFDIFNFGYFLDVFNISDSFKGGQVSANVDYINGDEGNKYKIVINSHSSLAFYDNAETKKMESDNLFVKIKDKIFSNNKTTFSRVYSELDYIIDKRRLNIKRFIANNFKIGITAKGYYEFNSQILKGEGMIIPSYFINNLFGIGNVPLLGDIVNNLITGDKDGGVLGLRYKYVKDFSNKDYSFKTYPVSSILPSSIQMFFID